MQLVKSGTVTGTGAALNISLGWVPDYICVINVTDGDEKDEWFSDMPAGHSIQTTTAVAKITSNGFTAYEGTSSASSGITLGTAISENGKTLSYFAMRNL
jgi:hypothetical protein